MEVDTTNKEDLPEENPVIKGLRDDLKVALKAVKTAGVDAVALVERNVTASTLMPKGFEGFSDIFAKEVDGELTTESAAEWLKGRGFTASSDKLDEEAAQVVADLEEVTDLGGAVAAAGNQTPADSVLNQLAGVIKTGEPQSLTEVTEAIEKILSG